MDRGDGFCGKRHSVFWLWRAAGSPRWQAGSSAELSKELLEHRRRARLGDAAVNLGRMMTRRRRVKPHPVGRAEVNTADARERDRRRAHRAGLKRDVKIVARQPLAASGTARLTDCEDFGMGGWVAHGDDEIVPAPRYAAIRRNHDGADRRFARRRGQLSPAAIPGRASHDAPSDAQLRIGESLDSGFARFARAPE